MTRLWANRFQSSSTLSAALRPSTTAISLYAACRGGSSISCRSSGILAARPVHFSLPCFIGSTISLLVIHATPPNSAKFGAPYAQKYQTIPGRLSSMFKSLGCIEQRVRLDLLHTTGLQLVTEIVSCWESSAESSAAL